MSATTDPDGAAWVLRVLRTFGSLDMDSFDNRLRLQMLAYLIQEIGGGGPYVHHWAMRGPYSAALTEDLDDDREKGGGAPAADIPDDDRELAQRVRSLVGDVDDPLEAELYASVWFLAPTRRLSDSDRAHIRESMRRAKPHFAKERVGEALGAIEAFRAGSGAAPQGSAG